MEQYKKYFDFDGRATHSEYWGVSILSYVALLVFVLVGFLFTLLGTLVVCDWPGLATVVRRCHDAGINGWFTLAIFIPWFGFTPFIVFGCLKMETIDELYQHTSVQANIGDWGDEEWSVFTTWLKGALHTNILDVTFIKKDGTERLMKCTLNSEHLPKVEIKEDTKPRKESTTSMRAFDTEKNEWRSFKYVSMLQYAL